jgi:hypothetical protein
MVDIIPHIMVGDSAPLYTLLKFKERWLHNMKPHFVADSALEILMLLRRLKSGEDMPHLLFQGAMLLIFGILFPSIYLLSIGEHYRIRMALLLVSIQF